MNTTHVQDVTRPLQSLGFGEYEAQVYVTLLARGPLTGYQVAKASGVPRPNVYPVLDRLEQRGALGRVEGKRAPLYVARPAEEMLAGLASSVQAHLADARRELSALKATSTLEYVWNIQGYEGIMSRAVSLVDGARVKLLIGIWAEESRRLSDAVARAQARGVMISTLCIQGCPDECGGCRGGIYRYPLAEGATTRWLVLVADGAELLAGQVPDDGRASGASTTLEVFVNTAGQYLVNAIAVAEIARSLGPQMTELLDDQAREAVLGAGLADATGESWLHRMLAAVRERRS